MHLFTEIEKLVYIDIVVHRQRHIELETHRNFDIQ